MYLSFKDALLESSIENLLRREFPKVPFQIKETSKNVHIVIYVIPYKDRQKGKGTQFIGRIQELAKQYQKSVTLVADDGYLDSEGDMTLKQLKAWYTKMGFKNTQGDKFTYTPDV